MTSPYAPLADYLRQWLAAVPAAGLAIALTDRDRTQYAAALGSADLAARRPALVDTTFQIGSIGKSMTALAVLQLAQAGRLDLNAPVSVHLPWFALPSRYGPITLRHLLSHTAGLPAGTDFAPAARYEGFALRETEAAWEPGSRFHYSNTGYKLLGWLLEDVTGQDYGSIIRQRVLQPLGMNATDPVITHQSHHRMATGYVPLHDDRPGRPGDPLLPAPWFEYAVGDGSPAATAGDMARYARLFLNGGRGATGAIVSPDLFQQMITPTIAMDRGDAYQHDYGYGYGIISHQSEGHHFIGHGGSTVGFRAIMLTDQTDGLGVVILCNGWDVDTYEPARYALRFAAAVHAGDSPPEPPPLPDATRIPEAPRFAGDYVNAATGAILSIRARGERLLLTGGGVADAPLLRIAGHTFGPPDAAFDPFPLRFHAGAGDAGSQNVPRQSSEMIEITHGADVYVRQGATPLADDVPCPAQWRSFPGHYRSHAPYVSNFRIVLRRGRLYLAWPHGGEESLTPQPLHSGLTDSGLSNSWLTDSWLSNSRLSNSRLSNSRLADSGPSPRFLVGPPGEPTAEWLRFDPVVGARALRAQWAGGGSFYRV